jgi:hypothetical protein
MLYVNVLNMIHAGSGDNNILLSNNIIHSIITYLLLIMMSGSGGGPLNLKDITTYDGEKDLFWNWQNTGKRPLAGKFFLTPKNQYACDK